MRIISLLTVILTVSGLPSVASDTLVISSQRMVNTCSSASDRKFLIYVDLGEIYFSDSLMSFDIFLKYDTTKLVFTDMLTTGTLSAQMSDLGPVWRPKDPGGICYAGGGSILQPAKGKQPLIAFQGLFKGGCGDTTSISLDEVIFNDEFRRRSWSGTSGTIMTVARGTATNEIAAVFDRQQFITRGKDSIISIPLHVKTPDLINAVVECEIQMVGSVAFGIDTIYALRDDSTFQLIEKKVFNDTTKIKWRTQARSSQTEYMINVRSLTNEKDRTATIDATIQVIDSCYCRVALNTDTTRFCSIRNVPVLTSVFESVVDEGSAWCTTGGGDIIIQSLHGQPESVEVFTLLGERIPFVLRGDQQTMVITGVLLPNAPVLIRMQHGGEIRSKMVMK
ncbi:MAG: hypothetical protein JSS89_10105 [Bacteroidetes bacterium]|nr:hypothetical protein [Bacteroidota bacterium]